MPKSSNPNIVLAPQEEFTIEMMETVKVASLGQITDALFNVGGQYRRNMWFQIRLQSKDSKLKILIDNLYNN